ncbi:MAG: Yip1 family protein [Clostridia bacterium]
MKKFREDFKYLNHVIFHPFDGFYEVRFRGKGNYALVAILFILSGLMNVISYQYTGFIMNNNAMFAMNSVTTFIFGLFPYLLFAISNWSMTAIFEGSGKFLDILTVLAYSLYPKLILDVIVVIFSNVVTEEEAILLTAVQMIALVWFCFLVFSGLCVIHEYGAGRNLAMIIATFVAAVVVIFLATLYITLVEKVLVFIADFTTELARR